MNKAKLIEKAVEAGLDASGTVNELKDRLEAYRLTPKPIEDVVIKGNSARHVYRESAHVSK